MKTIFNQWYLARNKTDSKGHPSIETSVVAYPASLTGIRKYSKATSHFEPIQYIPTIDCAPYPSEGIFMECWGMSLSAQRCLQIFGCYPKAGELLYVEKTNRKWKSTKIDLLTSEIREYGE